MNATTRAAAVATGPPLPTLPPTPPPPVLPGVAFRMYRGLDDIAGMAAANAAMRSACGVLEPIDPVNMANHYTHLVGSDPLTDSIIAEVAGRVVGYARAEWHDLYDGDRIYDQTIVVDPEAGDRGIALALLRWTEMRLRAVALEHPTDRRAWLATESFDGDLELEAAIAALGYEPVRRFAEMLRPLLDEPLPEHPLAAGYAFQPIGAGDLRATWAMLEVSFTEHWGEWDSGDVGFAEWLADPRQRPELYVAAVHEESGAVASIVLNLLEPQPDGTIRGLLDGVASRPGHRRLGLARACIARSLRVLREHGATSAYLGVDTENRNSALELYASCGFAAVSSGHAYRRPFDAVAG